MGYNGSDRDARRARLDGAFLGAADPRYAAPAETAPPSPPDPAPAPPRVERVRCPWCGYPLRATTCPGCDDLDDLLAATYH